MVIMVIMVVKGYKIRTNLNYLKLCKLESFLEMSLQLPLFYRLGCDLRQIGAVRLAFLMHFLCINTMNALTRYNEKKLNRAIVRVGMVSSSSFFNINIFHSLSHGILYVKYHCHVILWLSALKCSREEAKEMRKNLTNPHKKRHSKGMMRMMKKFAKKTNNSTRNCYEFNAIFFTVRRFCWSGKMWFSCSPRKSKKKTNLMLKWSFNHGV